MNTANSNLNLQKITACLAQQGDIIAFYLFESMARGQANAMSDVDVAVLLNPDPGLEAAVERQIQLMVALENFADREVQVTILNRAPPC